MAERSNRMGRRAPKPPWPRPSIRGRWRRDHLRVARDSMRHVSRRLAATLLAWLLVGIALALPAALFLVQSGLSELGSRWDHRPGLSIYFEPGTSPDALAGVLRKEPGVDRVDVTTQEDALEEFGAQGQFADALAVLETNPLPASLRLVPVEGAPPTDLDRLAELAGRHPGVVEVAVERTWLERVSTAAEVARRLGTILGALFALGAVTITATSVRLAIEARLEELKVMKLVGASDAQVRRPFLYLGMLYGLGGGVLAAMILSVGLTAVQAPLADLLGSFEVPFAPAAFNIRFLAMLLGTGTVLGMTGAVLAVRQRRASLDIL